jgi:hypothetical protein
MALIPIQIPPGVYRNGTELQSAGRWYDANLVRWFEGTMRPVGGWEKRSNSAVTGAARGLITWRDNAGDRWIGIGTHSKLYAMNEAGVLKEITPSGFVAGNADATINFGYGGGFYGLEPYGIARLDNDSYLDATTWSMDTWGEYLVACSSSDGKLYEWQLGFTTPTVAAAITNAPVNNKALLVTAERFLFALGAGGDGRKVQWCDQEDNTDWTPTALNQAGDFSLNTVGTIMAGKRFRGVSLIWTNVDVHSAQYVGQPFVYGFEKVGSGCGLISPQAVAITDNAAIWMSRSGFFVYDGYVRPLASDVSDFIFRDINVSQISKVYSVHNSAFGEVWWFYPSAQSNEIDRYVIYNYRENHWAIGLLARTAGTDVNVFKSPIMVDTDGYVYEHELGFATDATNGIYAETGPVQIGVGDNVMMARELIPDELTAGGVQASFSTKFYPNAAEYSHGPYSLSNPTSIRFTGRQVKMKIEQVQASNWRVGVMRVDAVPGGRR